MSQIQNNENAGQLLVENNNKNIVINNQSNLLDPQNSQNNFPLINEPFMDPEINNQVINQQRPNNMGDIEHKQCITLKTFLICFASFIGTNAALWGVMCGFYGLLYLIISSSGGFYGSGGED